MRATGIIRQVDDLGKIAIPRHIRTIMDYNSGTPLEFFIDKDSLILRRASVETTPAEDFARILDRYDGELSVDIVQRINQIIDLLD